MKNIDDRKQTCWKKERKNIKEHREVERNKLEEKHFN